MKNVKLGLKIGMGFGVLLLMACALGVMAMLSMRNVAENATRLAEEYIPEVGLANELERRSLLFMQAIQGYAFTEEQSFRAESLAQMEDIKKVLDKSREFAGQHPRLVKLREDEATARARIGEIEKLSNQTETSIKAMEAIRKRMDAAAAAYMREASQYYEAQLVKFAKNIEEMADSQLLSNRLEKNKQLYLLVMEGEEIRIKNFKAQSKGDAAIMREGLEAFPKIKEALDVIRPITTQQSDLDILASIEKQAGDYQKAMEEMLVEWEKLDSIAKDRDAVSADMLHAAREVARAGMDHTVNISNDGVASLDRAQMIMAAGLLLALIIGVAVSIRLARAIIGPLTAGVVFAEKVAQGDLDGKLDIDQQDEIGRLAESLRKMVANLKSRIMESNAKSLEAEKAASKANQAMLEAEKAQAEAMAKAEAMAQAAERLSRVAEITTSASEELSAQIDESSKGAGVQAQRVAETATAMEEMNATVMEVAKNASLAAEISDDARDKAKEGAAIVSRVVDGIGEVQTQSMELKEDMATLGEQAEGIGRIMAVISDIADQTNLLALNAAIEAARAGEAGRGFAVVADEVRKLAEKTMTATKEVGDAIRGIQDGTRKNMNNVDNSVKTIGEATTLANESGVVLDAIVKLVENASDQVRAIAAASEQQSAASEEINRSIEDVNVISNETADAMAQAAQAVMELAGQSLELKTLIEEMTGGDSGPRKSLQGKKRLALA